jgi:predicted permease
MLLELRHALRRLRRSPGFSGVAIASLALGIGANSAIFNLVHAALMETVPVRDLDQLYWLRVNYPDGASARGFSYPFYKQLRQAGAVFQDVICSYPVPLSLSAATVGGSVAERIQGEIVSGNYFQMLGVGAYLGRLIGPADDRTRGGDPVAVLSFDFWKSRFGADPAILGREILLNNHRFTVIGISQPGYDGVENGTARKAVFAPMMMKAQLTPGWDALEMVEANWLWIVGRMRAGVPPAQAQAMADALYHGVREQQIRAVPGLTASQLQVELSGRMALRPLRDGGVGFQFRKPLVILMATVGLLLLIVCTNVANLLLARAAQNQKEIAVRLALGAGRARLAGQCLTEGLVLAGAGATLGLLLALWMNRTLLHFLVSPDVLNSIDLNPGWPVLLFTASVSVGAAILFSMAPALAAWKLDLNAGLKSAGASQRNLRNVLVTAQISLAVILAVGATLFAGTLAQLHTVDVRFTTENLLLASIDTHSTVHRRTAASLIAQLEERMAAARRREQCSDATLAGDDYAALFIPEGSDRDYTPNANAVGPGYFETMRIPIVLGRSFSALDHSSSRPVAIINQTLARRTFGGANPVGKRFRDTNGPGTLH